MLYATASPMASLLAARSVGSVGMMRGNMLMTHGASLRTSALSKIQQRGARATPPLRRNMQQQVTNTTGVAEAAASTIKKAVRHVFQPRRAFAPTAAASACARRVRITRHVHQKHGGSSKQQQPTPPKENKALTPTEEAAVAASERTHATNSRLGLTRNALVLRFSNENSYLNWARNGVLSSAVGVAMYAQEHHRGAQLSGAGLLLLGFGYIGVGTAKYIYYILRFRQVMELSWWSVIGTSSHASAALIIWLTATASFLESVPLELDAMLLTEPIIDFLPFRIRQGLIETYSLYLDDLEHHTDEQERVLRAIRGEQYEPRTPPPPIVPPIEPIVPPVVAPIVPPSVEA